jgi:predicted dinucleotide-binding enzyme
MTKVIVLIGAGSIGQAIARRVSAGKHVSAQAIRQVARERLKENRTSVAVVKRRYGARI